MAVSGIEDRVVAAMKDLGFTATDAKAYVALLKDSPATGYELAARSSVPRSAIYNVLRRLQALGLINPIQDKPARYVPLPPERLFELLETRFVRSLDSLKGSIDKLADRSADAVTWTVEGYEAMLEQAERLVADAKESVHGSLWGREARRLHKPLVDARARGVDVVLFSWNPLPEGLDRALSYGIREDALEEHWEHKIILIRDRAQLLVGRAEETDENRAVITNEPSLVEVGVSNLVLDITLYGERTGVDTAPVVRDLTEHLAPVENLLDEAKSS